MQVDTSKVDYDKLGIYPAQFTSKSGQVSNPQQWGPALNKFNYHVGTFTAKQVTIQKGEKVPSNATAYHPDYFDGKDHYWQNGIGVTVDTSKVNSNAPGVYPVTLLPSSFKRYAGHDNDDY